MDKLVLIDGNSILNRAFYGIMGSKMLMTKDGKYTNAVYGFLAILFNILDELNPKYLAVAFDLKAPTKRHELYKDYKANRKGMPNELAEQMPIIKEILKAMNIDVVTKEGYEADDILGTLAKYGEKQGLDVTILSGDRDTFQLASDNITIRIPRTKMGKTETEEFNRSKIKEVYGLEPKQLIEVKGLQGDASDNIPGVPGVGEKTATSLIKKYGAIDKLYKDIDEQKDDLKGKQKEKIVNNKELAYLSRTLGTIDTKVPIEDNLEDFKVEEWDKEKVLDIFQELNFKRYIERFSLEGQAETKDIADLFELKENESWEKIKEKIIEQKQIIYIFGTIPSENKENIIKEEITSISIHFPKTKEVYYKKIEKRQDFVNQTKEIWENKDIEKIGYKMKKDYILLKQIGIELENISYDIEVSAYILNPTQSKYEIEGLAEQYLDIDTKQYLEVSENNKDKQNQISLFEENIDNEEQKLEMALKAYIISNLKEELTKKLEEINAIQLFKTIEMPTVTVLANMQWNGMYVKENELNNYGKKIKEKIDVLTQEIHNLAGTDFNINSTKQLGEVLFEKLKLPVYKKTKSGYSTDVDVLEKLKKEHEIIPKILEYRQVMKLYSTYVEGLKQYINPKTKRIHSFFHQTITATGRISSTEPNLQNIPTRMELGKKLRKVFEPENGYVYIDADYSQIELRVLASISEDENMIQAFNHGEDIHKQVASQVFNVPIQNVTKKQRSEAKAVNFGIVYGISDFGLAEQLGITRKKAKQYIEQYLEKYAGIANFMDNITENAKQTGYVETLFHRRRYIPELKSNNYVVRQFGSRAAMNTPIQGTAADIMKIAMISVYKEIKNRNLKSKIVLQVHDEMMIEAPEEEKEEIKQILKQCMENATTLKVPLVAEVCGAGSWYDTK